MIATLRHLYLTILIACVADPAIARGALPVEAVLDFSHATSMTVAPVGDRIAWVSNLRGVRNVWVAEGPAWKARMITAYEGDDGQAIADLAFTQDGNSVLFIRGGRTNQGGDFPNPTSDPAGVKQTLWRVPFTGSQAPSAVADTGAYALFPDGKTVAYLHEGQLWSAPLTPAAPSAKDDKASSARQLLTVRRGVAAFTIAPNGARIALVSDRGDHSFVGVYDLAASTLTWLSPSVDHDTNPAWSPDSTRVVFLRTPHEAQILPFMPRREGLPWSLRVGDARTGETQEVFRATAGPGSASGAGYWFVGDRLWWGADERIVFTWERTGWLHLWSVPSSGGEAVDLTPGEGEVQHAELTLDRAAMLVASNHGDSNRRHLWRSDMKGEAFTLLTKGDGIEWAPRETAASKSLVFLAADARTPAHAAVLRNGQRVVLGTSASKVFPAQALVTPEPVSFRAADGLAIPGQLFAPPSACGDGPHPGLLFFHGGSRRQMMLGFHPSHYYSNAYAFNQLMASRCFVVLSVNYRSGIGYGLDFREALDYGAQGASEFRDVVGAGLYLAAREDVDGARIGLWGGSYGGYLTALGLARAPELFTAGVDLHGVHDWNVVIGNFAGDYDPRAREDFARLARQSSPIADLSRWRAPVLLIHGDDDRNVPFSESVSLTESLRRQGTAVELLVFPDEVHGFLLHRNWLAAYRASARFLQRELGATGE